MALKAKPLLVLLFLIAALFFYAIGNFTGILFLVVLGGFFELLFWAKLFKRKR